MLVLPVFSRAGITCKTGTAVPESLFVPVFERRDPGIVPGT